MQLNSQNSQDAMKLKFPGKNLYLHGVHFCIENVVKFTCMLMRNFKNIPGLHLRTSDNEGRRGRKHCPGRRKPAIVMPLHPCPLSKILVTPLIKRARQVYMFATTGFLLNNKRAASSPATPNFVT
jgi:hypothetical protein